MRRSGSTPTTQFIGAPGEYPELLLGQPGKQGVYLVHFAYASEKRVDLQKVRGRGEEGAHSRIGA